MKDIVTPSGLKSTPLLQEDIPKYVGKHIEKINNLLERKKYQLNQPKFEKCGLLDLKKRIVPSYIMINFSDIFTDVIYEKIILNEEGYLNIHWIEKICEFMKQEFSTKGWLLSWMLGIENDSQAISFWLVDELMFTPKES